MLHHRLFPTHPNLRIANALTTGESAEFCRLARAICAFFDPHSPHFPPHHHIGK
jgi:hypothetical protein